MFSEHFLPCTLFSFESLYLAYFCRCYSSLCITGAWYCVFDTSPPVLEISHWLCLRIAVAFLRSSVTVMALYTRWLFLCCFLITVESQIRAEILFITWNLSHYSVSYYCDFSGSPSPSFMTLRSSLRVPSAVPPALGSSKFCGDTPRFFANISNENPEAKTDFWEIPIVLLLAW